VIIQLEKITIIINLLINNKLINQNQNNIIVSKDLKTINN